MRSSIEVIRIIKQLREKKGLSVEELARRVGVAKSTLSRYENGQREFPINDLDSYAAALDTSIEHLLGLESTQKQIAPLPLIPLIGTICAGEGLLANQNIDEYIQYPFVGKRQPNFALNVKGDSMIGAGIEDGDIVYLRSDRWPEFNGQIVAVVVNDTDHGSLKRIKWSAESSKVQLVPENNDFAVLEYFPHEITICGLYMGHFKPEREF